MLCVFPAYTPSFGTFAHAYRLMGVTAFMPPQGLLAIAAYLPEAWDVRFVDENIARATPEDFAWADAVFVSGMHIQEKQIDDIRARAQAAGKVAVLGGPSVSGAPEIYPEFDYLHLGELGDATDRLIALLDESVARPARQVVLKTDERLPLSDFPTPAYSKAKLSDYLIGTFQFSSGCPYRCEFCDIPALYGRQPRLKTPRAAHHRARRDRRGEGPPRRRSTSSTTISSATRRRRARCCRISSNGRRSNGYPLGFACEATLNIAKQPEILELMREAGFTGIFVGIETPELDALMHMTKEHNASLPMYEAIATLNSYGLDVSSGIIIGLDTDTPQTVDRLIEFIERSQDPDADDQPPAGAAEDAALRPAEARRAHRRRPVAGIERAVPAPLRRGDRLMAPRHRLRLHAGAPVRALPPPGRRDLRQPHEAAGKRQAQGRQPEARADAARKFHHRARHPRRLPPRLLARLPLRHASAGRSTPRSAWPSCRTI